MVNWIYQTFVLQQTSLRKGKVIQWEKNLLKSYMNKELEARVYNISYNSGKRQIIKLKLGQNMWIDIPQKKIHKWPIITWKVAQHHES